MKTGFIILSLLTMCTLGANMIDDVILHGKYYNKIVYGSDCNYNVPSGYKIMYNDSSKKYVVANLVYGDYYLYNGKHGITSMFSSISIPSLFDDSCTAKAYLKAYLKDEEPTIKGYK